MDQQSALSMIRNHAQHNNNNNNNNNNVLRCPLCRQQWTSFLRVPVLKQFIDELKRFKNMSRLQKLHQSLKMGANAVWKSQ